MNCPLISVIKFYQWGQFKISIWTFLLYKVKLEWQTAGICHLKSQVYPSAGNKANKSQ